MEITPIGYIRTVFKEKFGIPRQSGRTTAKGEIIFYPPYSNPTAFKGLEGFSHIWIIFDFSLSHKVEFSPTVRPPKLGGKKTGVFATRSPFRPNSIGLSAVKLIRINTENGETSLEVEGADILDGTPVYDVKPYIPYSDGILDAVGGFAEEKKEKTLAVEFADGLSLSPEDRLILKEIISDDPRPAYDPDGKSYGMAYKDKNITFTVKDGVATVLKITDR